MGAPNAVDAPNAPNGALPDTSPEPARQWRVDRRSSAPQRERYLRKLLASGVSPRALWLAHKAQQRRICPARASRNVATS